MLRYLEFRAVQLSSPLFPLLQILIDYIQLSSGDSKFGLLYTRAAALQWKFIIFSIFLSMKWFFVVIMTTIFDAMNTKNIFDALIQLEITH